MINEKLFEDIFGIVRAKLSRTKYHKRENIAKNVGEAMPVKENESQKLIKKSPEPFLYRQGEYKNFKEAFNASGFTPFTADIFGRGEDEYRGKESKMLDYLTELYTKMYGDGEMEYQKQELVKSLEAIDSLRSYIPV